MRCPNYSCSKELSDFAVVCPSCGWNKREEERMREEKFASWRREAEHKRIEEQYARQAEERRQSDEKRRIEEERTDKAKRRAARVDGYWGGMFWGTLIFTAFIWLKLDYSFGDAVVAALVLSAGLVAIIATVLELKDKKRI